MPDSIFRCRGGYDGSGGTDPDGAGKVEADPADEEGDRGK